jgi:hypothetical protein
MTTITQRYISLTPVVVVDRDLAVVVLFSVLGLLASVYFMTHFPLSLDDATNLASWL